MTGIDRRLRDLLDAATGEPPHQLSATATHTPGQPVRLPLGYPFAIAIKP